MKVYRIIARKDAIIFAEEIGELSQVPLDDTYVLMKTYDCRALMDQAASFLAIEERKAEILNELESRP